MLEVFIYNADRLHRSPEFLVLRIHAENSAHYQFYRHPCTRCLIKFVDEVSIRKRIHLQQYPTWLVLLRLFDFIVDELMNFLSHNVRAGNDRLACLQEMRACLRMLEEIENPVHIGHYLLIRREQTMIGVDFRRFLIEVARADESITYLLAIPSLFYHAEFGMHFHVRYLNEH